MKPKLPKPPKWHSLLSVSPVKTLQETSGNIVTQKPRKPLSAVSVKRKGWNKLYRQAKKDLGNGPHVCPVCGETVYLDQNASCHHPKGRRKLEHLLDFFPVHNPCHDRIHASPNWAMMHGFLHPEYRK